MVGVPLNIMCSKRWAMPVMPGRSLALPTCATQPAGNGGLIPALDHEQSHSVGKFLFLDRDLLRPGGVGQRQERASQEKERRQPTASL